MGVLALLQLLLVDLGSLCFPQLVASLPLEALVAVQQDFTCLRFAWFCASACLCWPCLVPRLAALCEQCGVCASLGSALRPSLRWPRLCAAPDCALCAVRCLRFARFCASACLRWPCVWLRSVHGAVSALRFVLHFGLLALALLGASRRPLGSHSEATWKLLGGHLEAT